MYLCPLSTYEGCRVVEVECVYAVTYKRHDDTDSLSIGKDKGC
jgi:hypothetical protein